MIRVLLTGLRGNSGINAAPWLRKALPVLYGGDANGFETTVLFRGCRLERKQPLQPDMMLRNHIRRALKKLGITRKVGWHTFRHGVADLLRRNGVDVETAQELLRHANSRILMDIYQQTVTEERRPAQAHDWIRTSTSSVSRDVFKCFQSLTSIGGRCRFC